MLLERVVDTVRAGAKRRTGSGSSWSRGHDGQDGEKRGCEHGDRGEKKT